METSYEVWTYDEDGDRCLDSSYDSEASAQRRLEELLASGAEASLSETSSYSDFVKITPQIVRERHGLFVGDGDDAYLHLFCEVVANSVDEFLKGRANHILIEADEGSFVVEDNGEGLSKEKALQYLTTPHNSATADEHAPHIHLSATGVGLFVVNALSSQLVFESRGWRLEFCRGELRREGPAKAPGTRAQVTIDSDLILLGSLPLGLVRRLLFDSVHHFPGLKISFNGETFLSRRGLLELAEFEGAHADMLAHRRSPSRSFGLQMELDALTLNVALLGDAGNSPKISSWVNGAPTPAHGVHVDGVRAALFEVGWHPEVILVHAIMKEPKYAGPTKDKLGHPKVSKLVRNALVEPLKRFLRE